MSEANPRVICFHRGGEHFQRVNEDYFQDHGEKDPGICTLVGDCQISPFELMADKSIDINIDILIVEDDLQPLANVLNSAVKAIKFNQIIGICTDGPTLEMLFEKLSVGPKVMSLDFQLSSGDTRRALAVTEHLYDWVCDNDAWADTVVLGLSNHARKGNSEPLIKKMYQRGDSVFQKTTSIFDALDSILLDSMRKHSLLSKLNAHKNELKNRIENSHESVSCIESWPNKNSDPKPISKSPVFLKAVNDAIKVASSPSTVLLLGETGTGKGFFAKKILHEGSTRKNNRFQNFNVAGLTKELADSQLFGHVKGAFTDAQEKDGIFSVVEDGTIFLDEIGELPLGLQPKLLKALEEREFYKLGGTTVIKHNARVIAATNRDLKSMIENGDFREDLYYRLNIIPIRIPPLREHPEDIPDLIKEFFDDFGLKGRLSDSAFRMLCDYDYPGNIRELKTIVERLSNFYGDEEIIDIKKVYEYYPKLRAAPSSSKLKNLSHEISDGNEKIRKMLDTMEYMKGQGKDHGKIGLKLFTNCTSEHSARVRFSQWLQTNTVRKTIGNTPNSGARWEVVIAWYKNNGHPVSPN